MDFKKSVLNFKQKKSGGTERSEETKVAADLVLKLGTRAVLQAVRILRRQFPFSLEPVLDVTVSLPCPGGVFMDTNRAGSAWFQGRLWQGHREAQVAHQTFPGSALNAAEGASAPRQQL